MSQKSKGDMSMILEHVARFARDYMLHNTNKEYHNKRHIMEVYIDAKALCEPEGILEHESFIISTAAYTHDLINNFGRTYPFYSKRDAPKLSDEKRTAQLVTSILPDFGYDEAEIEFVAELIKATEFGIEPKGHAERIIKDADMSNLGKNNFFDQSELVRMELRAENNYTWLLGRKKLLEGHKFYTDSANQLWGSTKKENLEKVLLQIKYYEKMHPLGEI